MSKRLMVPGLKHAYAGQSDRVLFELIDENGGWPVGYQYVGFEHSDSRDAGFTNSHNNDGYWTVLNSADDYYIWKLSPDALQRVADAVHAATQITKVAAPRLYIKTYRGHKAELQVKP